MPKKTAEEKEKTAGNEELKKHLFPYSNLRDVQKDMIVQVARILADKKNLIVHAPTGLGKTAAAISPALRYAIDNKKKVFFLTSRHTQHMIAIETLKEIKEKHGVDFIAVDLIGKKWMCTIPGIEALHTSEFYEYCKKNREEGTCEQYTNTKKGSKLTTEAKLALEMLRRESPCHIEKFAQLCRKDSLCAYELATLLAKEATVIVADYYYIYNKKVRDTLFNKAGIALADCIVIVDEGHNLPDRIRNLMTSQLSNYMIKRAVNEAKKLDDKDILDKLAKLQDILNELSQDMRDGDEKNMTRDEFVGKVAKVGDYDKIIADFEFTAQMVREKEKQSSLGGIAAFLESWRGEDKGYARILSQKETKRESVVVLSYRCLDPGIVSQETIGNCHSTIIMSGTLTPTAMYKDLLGFPADTEESKYPSPFPEKNRLTMIIPETTTQFAKRNADQYRRIAEICAEITNLVPGNSALFFPSYFVRDNVYRSFAEMSGKTAFVESPEMDKEEKAEFLEGFKRYKDSGAVLLGVVSGSYGEGIDLPGDLLKCVVVVGLPLQQPTLETKELINYYDIKFGKGWDYGYVGPAFSKTLQSAGRCIRSEKDRGIIIFLDERYTWQNYFKHFPIDWNIKITKLYADKIRDFFSKPSAKDGL
ncbi:ATP-dependent DNA helicase [Candidatus Woesearchaeota archaeon]|nr:ATP-dependent DNA helicase [Candidatus Woesearchaeota archaeon]